MYHHYTVDEHLIRRWILAAIERAIQAGQSARQRTRRPHQIRETLYALFFSMTSPRLAGNHSEAGAAIARRFVRARFQTPTPRQRLARAQSSGDERHCAAARHLDPRRCGISFLSCNRPSCGSCRDHRADIRGSTRRLERLEGAAGCANSIRPQSCPASDPARAARIAEPGCAVATSRDWPEEARTDALLHTTILVASTTTNSTARAG